MKIAHYIITRFNLPVARPNKNGVQQDHLGEWLYNRCALFEKYCLPSVNSQTNKNFKWILIFDRNTPVDIINKYRSDIIEPVTFEKTEEQAEADVCQSVLASYLKTNEKADLILTSRLDNDDMLHKDFVEDLQKAAVKSFEKAPVVLQFPIASVFDIRKKRWKKY